MDDLEWVRWRLDRLVSARLLGPLNAELEAEYDYLSARERLLMLSEEPWAMRDSNPRPPARHAGALTN